MIHQMLVAGAACALHLHMQRHEAAAGRGVWDTVATLILLVED